MYSGSGTADMLSVG